MQCSGWHVFRDWGQVVDMPFGFRWLVYVGGLGLGRHAVLYASQLDA